MPAGRKGPDGLNDKQRAFVQEYIVDFNATQAAIRAGYAPRAAQEQSSRLLSKAIVGAAVAAAIQARSERTQITADRVLQEFAVIGFMRPSDYVAWREGTWGTEVTVKPSDEVDTRPIASVKPVMLGKFRTGVEIKFHDKLAALTKLGEHLGMWKRDPGQDDGTVLNVNINTTPNDG